MKALLLRCLLVAILAGPAIDLISKVASFHSGIKYDPPFSETERRQMGNLTVNEMEAALAKRRVKMTRWDWLWDSVPYSYFWKEVARDSIVPICGVFLACACVGWMETKSRPK